MRAESLANTELVTLASHDVLTIRFDRVLAVYAGAK